MKEIHVKNEIGRLKRILLHRPGKELLNLTPDSLEKLLFDDIPYLHDAQKEHDAFADILRSNGVEIVYLEDLMAEVIASDSTIRTKFINQFIEEAGITSPKYQKYISEYLNDIADPKSLVLKTMEGIQKKEINIPSDYVESSLVDIVPNNNLFLTDPMPNLYFTRDNFACVGNGINLYHMYSKTRNRENIYAEYIFNYHSDYCNVKRYYERNNKWHTEGGDFLNLTEKTVAIGITERTEPEAINQLAKNYFADTNCSIDTVLAINIPSKRAFMHLDTVLSQIDRYTFLYHQGILKELEVYEIKKDNSSLALDKIIVKKIKDPLNKVLETYLKHNIKLIPCAGGDEISSSREQWSDASNVLCIRPGLVIVYNRNSITNELLRKEGIEIIEIQASELARGRGGPRCMSMALEREDIEW